MNFFDHQAQARKSSRRLVLMFALAVIAVVLAVTAVMFAGLVAGNEKLPPIQVFHSHVGLLAGVALGTLGVILLSSAYKTAKLGTGGGAVARSLGGVRVDAATADPGLRRLRNVVEEIAIAAGVPVPEIYLLEGEAGINAFAAGWSPSDAAIAVTRGTLEKLSRDELQGVIAHEYSHILNGDMRLNIRLMGLLFGLLVLVRIASELMEGTSRSRSKDKGAVFGFALAVMIIGSIGLFFGRLIKASISRSREFLADASAVQFTRQTAGIAGALKKIAGINTGSRLSAAGAEEVSHMLFGDGAGLSRLFATHPPLLDRIKRMEPGFRMERLAESQSRWNEPDYVAEDLATEAPITSAMSNAVAAVSAETIVEQVAHPSCDDYRHAEALHQAIPESLKAAAASTASAVPLLLALLLDTAETVRDQQLQSLHKYFGPKVREIALDQAKLLWNLPPAQRLPLAALAFPALRQLPRDHIIRFMAAVNALIQADGQTGMFEFCLGSLLRTQIGDVLYPAKARIVGKQRLGHCRAAVLDFLAVLAQQGHPAAADAGHAFQAGLAHLFGNASDRYVPPATPAATAAQALRQLDALDAPGKQLLIEAMVKAISHDHRLTVGELELLRAVCACLHCPLPPLTVS